MRSLITRRLDRLMPALTFEERLDGMLAALQDERHPESALLSTMARTDHDRWNRAADVVDGVRSRLGPYVELLESFVSQLELRLVVADQAHFLAVSLRWRGTEMAEAAGRLHARVVAELALRWNELRLAEQAAESFAEEMGGRELLQPEVRTTLEQCRARLMAVHDVLSSRTQPGADAVGLEDPGEEELHQLLALVDASGR